MSKKRKITLGILIAGISLSVIGTPMFIVSGVGVKTIDITINSDIKTLRSGFFYYKDNFNSLLPFETNFTESYAKENGYSYDFYGLSEYSLNKIENETEGQVNVPPFMNIPSINDVKNFYSNSILNKPLLISGSVILSIGLLIILISLPLFLYFRKKG